MKTDAIDLAGAIKNSRVDDKANRPKRGEFYWVTYEGDKKKKFTELFCVHHLASNHVEFRQTDGNCYSTHRVRYSEMLECAKLEPRWREVIAAKMAEKQVELAAAVRQLTDEVANAGLIEQQTSQPAEPVSLLPTLARQDPAVHKRALVKLKDKTFPALHKTIEGITQEIVELQRELCRPFLAEAAAMKKAVEKVEDRLFVLELYSGIWDKVEQIKKGQPAPVDTPITIRQMMRYMDEECLIDYDKGGMDHGKIKSFDDWVGRPENLFRLCPEPRCLVALKVRRHAKDYGPSLTLGEAFMKVKWQQYDKKTYLLIRNGDQGFRLETEIDFDPRLLPFRSEFHKPFTKRDWYSDPERTVTPDDLDYDEVKEKRMKEVFSYNRVMFLIQGLLDRSKVFAPHPPINLGNDDVVRNWIRPNYDEEDGLPSSNPPKWEDYRDAANAKIRPGTYVWCNEREDRRKVYNRFGSWEKDPNSTQRPTICEVHSVSRDRKKVKFKFSLGDRIKERWELDKTRPVPNKPGWFYRKLVEDNFGEKFGWQTVEMQNCFNVEAYQPGDYKPFLCDAHLKGEYLKWAPQLLSAEDWHLERMRSVDTAKVKTKESA